MTVFKGGEAIKDFLEEFDSWLSESVTARIRGLKSSGLRTTLPYSLMADAVRSLRVGA